MVEGTLSGMHSGVFPLTSTLGAQGSVAGGRSEGVGIFSTAMAEDDMPGPSSREAWRAHEGLASGAAMGECRMTGGDRRQEPVMAVPGSDAAGARCEPVDADRAGEELRRNCAWIVGHSFIHRAYRRAKKRPDGENLNLTPEGVRVRWIGKGGLRWGELCAMLQGNIDRWGAPEWLIIHLGGNDVGRVTCRELIKMMRKDMASIMNRLPHTKLGWSDVIIRLKHQGEPLWRNGVKKLNRQVGKWLVREGGFWIRHQWSWKLLSGYFLGDGVHLSDVGIDLFNNALEDGIRQQVIVRGPQWGYKDR
ncbi:uncharacterized protein LOC115095151 [Rhinatrema bivittatum]|uniref:uncharacterized protein LOC115095151 n=1 Tax=Rhinatrema bivittatum TaxID=194408 RepID=UPI0011284735|nr:uncharacterized protein LOC115095151 [Rhinatrema bivittatum]